jgi:hypothetical protein
MQASTQKIKIFGRGNQKLFTFEELLGKFIEGPKIPSSKLTEISGVKGVTFDSLKQIF